MAGRRILLGVIGRAHGVRGLVRVHSYAADPASLAGYGPLQDDRGRHFQLRWRGEGIAELAEIVDGRAVPVSDRTAAEKLVNTRLSIERDRLPPPDAEEFYLADLIGLSAATPDGAPLGRVDAVHDHGAGTYLEIGALLVPFTRACVPEVDVAGGRVTVLPPAVREADGQARAGAGDPLAQPSPAEAGREGFGGGDEGLPREAVAA